MPFILDSDVLQPSTTQGPPQPSIPTPRVTNSQDALSIQVNRAQSVRTIETRNGSDSAGHHHVIVPPPRNPLLRLQNLVSVGSQFDGITNFNDIEDLDNDTRVD